MARKALDAGRYPGELPCLDGRVAQDDGGEAGLGQASLGRPVIARERERRLGRGPADGGVDDVLDAGRRRRPSARATRGGYSGRGLGWVGVALDAGPGWGATGPWPT